MYNDPTSSSSAAAGGENSLHNAWSVLANTEQWISSTLAHSSSSSSGNNNSNNNNNAMDSAATLPSAAASNNNNNNPYVRKEVSYVCENQSATSMVVAGIFRRLKEAREMGQAHGQAERERSHTQGTIPYSMDAGCCRTPLGRLQHTHTHTHSRAHFACLDCCGCCCCFFFFYC